MQRKFKIFLFNKCVGASHFVRSVDLTPNYSQPLSRPSSTTNLSRFAPVDKGRQIP